MQELKVNRDKETLLDILAGSEQSGFIIVPVAEALGSVFGMLKRKRIYNGRICTSTIKLENYFKKCTKIVVSTNMIVETTIFAFIAPVKAYRRKK